MDQFVSDTVDDLVDKIKTKIDIIEPEIRQDQMANEFHNFLKDILDSLERIQEDSDGGVRLENSDDENSRSGDDEFQESDVEEDDYE